MKKCWGSILGAGLFICLSACGGNNDSTEESGQSSEGGNSNEPEEVLIWDYFTGVGQEVFYEQVEEFNESQDDIVVKTEYVPFDQIKQQLSVGSTGGELPDIVNIDHVDNAALASQGVLADITDKVDEWGEAENFLEGPLNSTVYEGSHYGLPYTSNTLGLFYNEDLLEEAGFSEPPETWEELEEVAGAFSEDDVDGFGIAGERSEESTFQFYPFLRSAGADYNNLDSPEAIEAMSFLDGLLEQGYMSSDVVNTAQDGLTNRFTTGDLAMMINGSWNIERIMEENPSMNWQVAEIPRAEEHASVIGGANLSIVKGANEEPAWEFMKWLMDPEQLESYAADSGVFPPRQDILDESDHWDEDEYLSSFVPMMEYADARGPSPNWPDISESIQLAIQESFTDSKTPEEAMNDAADKVSEVVEE
ncbi:ABC transporter substrate-binding protein [Salibacterium halotolerans]|uniref:Multiple sugar transport system substrate-binding protein n=1 Tax=Salibacterium halotolerans TaxID=1884432 RepID=A0A1I5Y9B9_9BACI|nr:ABC transporter substrate-binding protein [Salibacterium halotolerans]SFQ40831.1 multiple sugar transport system substrate-binding protein [Salibacterium halotolerans]